MATRATTPIPMREVADGKLPQDPAQHAIWLNAGADRIIEAVTAAGSDQVWTLAGIGPASFWAVSGRASASGCHRSRNHKAPDSSRLSWRLRIFVG